MDIEPITKLERMLLEELRCPLCNYYMVPPIHQCQKGHSICGHCSRWVRICPTCRSLLTQTRSFDLETIYEKLHVPCKYTALGCNFINLAARTERHQEYCRLRKKTCPYRTYQKCRWRNTVKELWYHLAYKHLDTLYFGEKLSLLAPNFKNITDYSYGYIMIHAHNEWFRLTWELDENTDMTRWAIYFMGSPGVAETFICEIEFPGDVIFADTSPLFYKSSCAAMPDDDVVKFVEDSYFRIKRSKLNTYCLFNGDLKYIVTIHPSYLS